MFCLQESVSQSHNPKKRNIKLTPGGVLVVDVLGLVTDATACAVMGAMRVAAGGGARAFCINADKALIAMGPACLEAVDPRNLAPMPGCYVVSAEVFSMVRAHTQRMGRAGIVRETFTSLAKALEWSERQARIEAAQALWERARCPAL